ncbi:MAG: NifB/NifX family molybdenum-iron cluster-binding protein [Spirochaetes bacterium]|nr:NifB/NifX family molybdenum-iron cluster-binding protein [Spirochaetota bacterium]
MLIAIAASGAPPEAPVEERFGRARGFSLYDTDQGTASWHDNSQNLQAPQGAGIQAAKHVIESGANALIARNVGPKAFDLLTRHGIAIYLCPEACRTVGDAVEGYNRGTLEQLSTANQDGHW